MENEPIPHHTTPEELSQSTALKDLEDKLLYAAAERAAASRQEQVAA